MAAVIVINAAGIDKDPAELAKAIKALISSITGNSNVNVSVSGGNTMSERHAPKGRI